MTSQHYAVCPRCGTTLTLSAAIDDPRLVIIGTSSLTRATPMLAELIDRLPWTCARCGEDPSLIDEHLPNPVDSLTAWRRLGEAAAGNTPAARAASDADLRRCVAQRLDVSWSEGVRHV